MTRENGVLANISDLYREASDVSKTLEAQSNREPRTEIHQKGLGNARETAYKAWNNGELPSYAPENAPEDASGLTPEQITGIVSELQRIKLHEAADDLYNNRDDVIARISDKGIEYLARQRTIQENNPNIPELLKARQEYESAQQLVKSFEDTENYSSALNKLGEEDKKELISLAMSELKKDIDKRYKVGFVREIAYESAVTALRTGGANDKYILAAVKKYKELAKKALENIEKQAGGDLRKSVSNSLDGLITGSAEDILQGALPLVDRTYKFEKAVEKQEKEKQRVYAETA